MEPPSLWLVIWPRCQAAGARLRGQPKKWAARAPGARQQAAGRRGRGHQPRSPLPPGPAPAPAPRKWQPRQRPATRSPRRKPRSAPTGRRPPAARAHRPSRWHAAAAATRQWSRHPPVLQELAGRRAAAPRRPSSSRTPHMPATGHGSRMCTRGKTIPAPVVDPHPQPQGSPPLPPAEWGGRMPSPKTGRSASCNQAVDSHHQQSRRPPASRRCSTPRRPCWMRCPP
mmetsp:Transcript_10826/g.29454  ORF Transcript_10826/g.29454 Transcript_10826/m.29454 type:complete len:227 (+) Transcript_10826:301-981(+)